MPYILEVHKIKAGHRDILYSLRGVGNSLLAFDAI